MAKLTDSSMGKLQDQEIVFTSNVDCPECGTTFDVAFPTGALDEDGLTDVDELEAEATCPNPDCVHEFTAEYSGWAMYGEG